nr:MAG TPA_asm: hypothetical protein [Caudoviricetes sp.]DAZ25783.1 MAG TPA: hypothetical protein [Caudoviricetes sp.]
MHLFVFAILTSPFVVLFHHSILCNPCCQYSTK